MKRLEDETIIFIVGMIATVLLVLLSGCCSTRTVEVPGETPPPSVVTVTDTLFLASPPDTVFAPPDTVEVVRTVPYEIIRYLEPRADTARAALVWHLAVDSAAVVVSLRQEDLTLRRPAPGETLRCVARGPSALDCRVEGEPVPEPTRTIECPACEAALFANTWRGWLKLVGLLFVVSAVVATAVAILRS